MKLKKPLSYCAVIIWYNPSQSDIANTHNLAELIPCVLVIDNSDNSNSLHIKKTNIQYYPLHNNLGIATALNYGFQKAFELGFKYALSLDQDSNFDADNLLKFEEQASQLFKDGLTAIVAASLQIDNEAPKPQIKKTNITSGSMTSLNAWKQVGGFKDDFFIDHVDHEFCLRLNQRNFLIYQLPDVYMKHALGYPKTKKLLGKIYTSPGYSADRLYYYYRNRLYLAKYRKESFHSVSMFLYRKARLILLVEDKRLPKIVAMLTGVAHYLMKKSGPRKSRIK